MPGHSTPGKVSADKKRNDNHQKKQTLLKRIRVIYTDPDLTDSSSDDEQGTKKDKHYTSNGEKRCVREVGVFGSVPNIKKSGKVTSQNGTRLKSKYVGVRQRISGKWAAEIRDNYHHVRLWLGTYNTEEEAHSAYENKRLEIQSLMEQKKVNSKDVHCFRSVAMSPASVLEVSNAASNVSDRSSKANAGCSKKDVEVEKSGVDDEIKPADVNNQIKGFDDFKEDDFLMCTLGNLADGPNSSCLLDLDLEDYTWLDEILKLCGLQL